MNTFEWIHESILEILSENIILLKPKCFCLHLYVKDSTIFCLFYQTAFCNIYVYIKRKNIIYVAIFSNGIAPVI